MDIENFNCQKNYLYDDIIYMHMAYGEPPSNYFTPWECFQHLKRLKISGLIPNLSIQEATG